MTDRYHALTVPLATDTRSDDCKPLIQAIRQLKGVLDVQGKTGGRLLTDEGLAHMQLTLTKAMLGSLHEASYGPGGIDAITKASRKLR